MLSRDELTNYLIRGPVVWGAFDVAPQCYLRGARWGSRKASSTSSTKTSRSRRRSGPAPAPPTRKRTTTCLKKMPEAAETTAKLPNFK